MAVSLNHEAIVQQLLTLGAGLIVQDKEGLTPVMTACHYGHIQSLEQIATKGLHPSSELLLIIVNHVSTSIVPI